MITEFLKAELVLRTQARSNLGGFQLRKTDDNILLTKKHKYDTI